MSLNNEKEEDACRAAKAALLWNFYLDHLTQARHHETLRAGTTATVVLGSGAVIAALVGDEAFDLQGIGTLKLLFSGMALCLLGGLGGLSSAKHFEIFERQLQIAYSYRDALETLFSEGGITLDLDSEKRDGGILPLLALRNKGERNHERIWDSRGDGCSQWWAGCVRRLRLFTLTNLIHLSFLLVGLALLAASLLPIVRSLI